MEAHMTLKLAAFFGVHLFFGLLKYNIWISLRFSLSKSINNALDFTVFVKRVFVEAALNAYFMNSCHIDNI